LVSQIREPDWIFSTESGHLQLLLSSPGISQLILIGNNRINGSDSSPLTYHKRDDAQYVKNRVLKPGPARRVDPGPDRPGPGPGTDPGGGKNPPGNWPDETRST